MTKCETCGRRGRLNSRGHPIPCHEYTTRENTKSAALILLADKKNAAAFFNSPEALQFCAEVLRKNEGFVEKLTDEIWRGMKKPDWFNKLKNSEAELIVKEAIKKAAGLEGD